MANSLGVATALAGGGYRGASRLRIAAVAVGAMPMAASLIVAFTFVEPPRTSAPFRTRVSRHARSRG